MRIYNHAGISGATKGGLRGGTWPVRGEDTGRTATGIDTISSENFEHFGMEEIDAERLEL